MTAASTGSESSSVSSRRRSRWTCSRAIMTGSATSTPSAASSASRRAARAARCASLRLEETARQARAHGFDFFGTTLTVSPHKDAQRLNAIGAELAQQYGVRWLPSDFKKREGYKRSIELSKQYGLYRQEYCGCLYSKPVDNAAAGE